MPDTLPLIELSDEEYVDLNTLSGITVGSAISIQNQSDYGAVRLSISSTKPEPDTDKYVLLYPDPRFLANIDSGETTVWAMAHTIPGVPVAVQVV